MMHAVARRRRETSSAVVEEEEDPAVAARAERRPGWAFCTRREKNPILSTTVLRGSILVAAAARRSLPCLLYICVRVTARIDTTLFLSLHA